MGTIVHHHIEKRMFTYVDVYREKERDSSGDFNKWKNMEERKEIIKSIRKGEKEREEEDNNMDDERELE